MNFLRGKARSLDLTGDIRLAIDLGIPIISVPEMMETICQEVENGNAQYQHAFYKQCRDILRDEDSAKVA